MELGTCPEGGATGVALVFSEYQNTERCVFFDPKVPDFSSRPYFFLVRHVVRLSLVKSENRVVLVQDQTTNRNLDHLLQVILLLSLHPA